MKKLQAVRRSRRASSLDLPYLNYIDVKEGFVNLTNDYIAIRLNDER